MLEMGNEIVVQNKVLQLKPNVFIFIGRVEILSIAKNSLV